jgi:hypothetical protein
MQHTWPVIMYPEGVQVGSVKSGKDKRSGKVRHVAIAADGTRAGTFDTLRQANEHLIAQARENAPA